MTIQEIKSRIRDIYRLIEAESDVHKIMQLSAEAIQLKCVLEIKEKSGVILERFINKQNNIHFGYNCNHVLGDFIENNVESKEDFFKRQMTHCSVYHIRAYFKMGLSEERYEECAIIRDIAKERGIDLFSNQ